ncbi:formin-J-like [Culex pipiens pallens]|uniref:formin-J-like n=1 Tax=Culex pipiens pallens TaxID=42434 RepID=UPI0019530A6B|nr:formin-J-like [Culex pipiens pallens]XP_039432129.1 formin-J-like [Culex pipiens pallens]
MEGEMDGAGSCYGGGDIAGAIFGTLLAVVLVAVLGWWLYKKGYVLKRKDSQLVPEDPEGKKDEYAFDNPAFKTGEPGTGTTSGKTSSPLDPSWTSTTTSAKQNSLDKRKTVDDSCINTTTPRLVSLRGSDFTGLGVEVHGGLKEGIFVKKVMPQGPAAGFINTGDRITSITIDFRHIVQEDAMTILSYASPYNVQLELVSGEKLPHTQSPKPGHQALTHPLVRSSSQSDMNTIERNSRKKLFPGDESGTATLKMEQPSPNNLNKVLPTVHKENEKEPKKHSFKQQMREMIEEKFQTKSANTDVERKDSNAAEGKKGHKFGIRVFPPSVNDKLFGRSPTKIQADNENNTNIEKKESDEKKEKSPSPPVVKKRTKEPKSIPDVIVVESATTNSTSVPMEFQRQGSLTSSGTMRNPAGIPQEVSGMMMQAANAAKDNRKSSNLDLDNKRKGKAPRPPQNENDLDGSTVTMDTNLSMDMTDGASRMLNGSMDIVPEAESDVKKFNLSERMNFSDNFAEEVLNCTIESISGIDKFDDKGPSNSSTPKSERKKSSLTESMTHDEHDSDTEDQAAPPQPMGNKIELNSSDITVHQSSPSPADSSSEDMMEDSNPRSASLGDLSKLESHTSNPGSASNTLERAQSLEITGEVVTVAGGASAVVVGADSKRKISQVEGQVVIESMESTDGLNSLQRNRLKGASAWGNLEDAINSGELLNSSSESELKQSTEDVSEMVIVQNGIDHAEEEPVGEVMTTVEVTMNGTIACNMEPEVEEAPKEDHVEQQVEVVTVVDKIAPPAVIVAEERKVEKENEREHVSLTTINMDYNGVYPTEAEQNKTDHVKIANYDTNIPDDVKVSRYPFGSLERPKSDVLKKLLGQKEELENTPLVFISGDGETNKITIENNYHDVGAPISLTLVNSADAQPIENDQTESSQASPVFSNTNGVSSINISSLEVDLTKSLNNKPFTIAPKFSLDNIVTISTESSQPSSIIMIDDEKLDFSLQTLDDFEDSIENTNAPEPTVNFASESNKTIIETAPIVSEQPKVEPNSFVTEIKVATPELEQNGKPEEPPKLTKKPPKPEKPTTPPSRIPVERRMSSEHSFIPRNTEIKFTTATYDAGRSAEKRPLGIDQIRSNFERSNSKPSFERSNSKPDVRPYERSNSKTDVRSVERRNSQTDVRPFERTNSKPDVRPYERSNSKTDVRSVLERSNSKTEIPVRTVERRNSHNEVRPFERSNSKPDVRPFERSNSKTDVRSVLERSNSKTEIPVLIRRTSIPSINLNTSNGSINSSPQAATMTNGNGTKASPSRIPVFNSVSKLNGSHDASPRPPPHNNNNNNNNSINNNHISNKVSVSITSIKNQSKHPSGKFNGN